MAKKAKPHSFRKNAENPRKKEEGTFDIPKKRRTKQPKTRNGGTLTESQFFGMLRAALRNKSRWWIPIKQALDAAKRKYRGTNKRQKWEYECSECHEWFPRANVEVHHETPVGSLACFEDLPGFVERLFAEDGYVVVCKECHLKITNRERRS